MKFGHLVPRGHENFLFFLLNVEFVLNEKEVQTGRRSVRRKDLEKKKLEKGQGRMRLKASLNQFRQLL